MATKEVRDWEKRKKKAAPFKGPIIKAQGRLFEIGQVGPNRLGLSLLSLLDQKPNTAAVCLPTKTRQQSVSQPNICTKHDSTVDPRYLFISL